MAQTRTRGPLRALTSWPDRLRRRTSNTDAPALLLLGLLVLAIVLSSAVYPDDVPYTIVILPLFLGSQWLGPRSLPWFVVATMVGVAVNVGLDPPGEPFDMIRVAITFVLGLLVLVASFRRTRLGVAGPRGEAMLVDLRDRIIGQGRIGELPPGWYARSVLRSSGGTAFAGDFVVADRGASGTRLQVVVVDVSGKGVEAGTRSLLLSGAVGGLLSALPADRFLPAANEFLLRQEWEEGFATAIHLQVDLETGEFEVRRAGHPPAVVLRHDRPDWTLLGVEAPALGLLPDAEFPAESGVLHRGDALMLYTDGVVEDPHQDISTGIDKLASGGRELLSSGFCGEERGLLERLGRPDDDRALLVVHRRQQG